MQPYVLVAGLVVALSMLTIVVSACVAAGRADDGLEALVQRERELRHARYEGIEPVELTHEPALFVSNEVA